MALAAVNITIGQALGSGRYSSSVKGGSVPDIATVTTNVATLVADGASPTQAHVTTLNTNHTKLAAAITGDVSVIWDGSTITSRNQLRHALREAIRAVEGGCGALSE
jgi:hypothetical protein